MSQYQVYVQTYNGKITDSIKATFYTLDDALAYRDWICSGNSLFVAYIREIVDPEESVLERAKKAYGVAESKESARKKRNAEYQRRHRAKKKAERQAVVSVCTDSDGNVVINRGEE